MKEYNDFVNLFLIFWEGCDQNNIHTKIIETLLDLKITNYWIMKIFSQFSICYLTHIILNKWKLWGKKTLIPLH